MFGQPLFRDSDLATYLRQREALIEARLTKQLDVKDLGRSEAEVVAEQLHQALLKPLRVDFDNPVNETARGRITTADNFYDRAEIDGVRVTRSFDFTGEIALFGMRPGRWSDAARGEILDANVAIGAEGSADVEGLRLELDRQETILREYVANSTDQVESHNAALEAKIAESVARRLEHLNEVERFRRRQR
jgi:hypothetical protein